MNADKVADAYVWGFPLVTMHRTRAMHVKAGAGIMLRSENLATPIHRTVVAPNNDTLYASGWYDLRAGDLVIKVEPMDSPERYWSVMLLDAYTNVTYVCRRLHGIKGTSVRVTLDPFIEPTVDKALEIIPMATPTVWVLARAMVNGEADLEAARNALSRIKVSQSVNKAVPDWPVVSKDDSFLEELRRAIEIDPPAPWIPGPPATMDYLLDNHPSEAIVESGIETGDKRIAQASGNDREGNGWRTRSRGAAFGDDVAYRASFARVSLAGHLPAENRSYNRIIDDSRMMRLRFPPGCEPPVNGFWSLTVYGADFFLVENEINRYSISNRTTGIIRDDDGGLTIDIGPKAPDNRSNWLPTPSGPCILVMRCYEGASEIIDATWFPPELETADGSI